MTQKEMLEQILRNQVVIMGALALEVEANRNDYNLRPTHARALRSQVRETMELLL